ncbi:PC-esterase domain-containing protein 1B-like [Elephas maximus indicus]|uniref:PC-esterase domain-containing protein 1B-like n=1 Tax=Elephas maximus indicus TaxID=99487 RepID=UPI00211712A8|nr:PC-esterase domain-containing protein 1B-like [Elephas maximus indicus]
MVHPRASEVRQLLHNKFVVVMGDSVQRAVYKDLVLLLQKDCLLSSSQLKAKGEMSFEQDRLLHGGWWGRRHNGTHYREVREFCSTHHLVRVYFLTRAYSRYVEKVLLELLRGEHGPDVVIMNSCLWDLSRYGQDSMWSYRRNLEALFWRLRQMLPESCLVVWNTAMPVAETVSGCFLPPEGMPPTACLREDVVEANIYSAAEASRLGFDVLDLHFHFRHFWQHRQPDGVHWNQHAHRRLSHLLLAHLANAWGVDLPCDELVGSESGKALGAFSEGPRATGCSSATEVNPVRRPRLRAHLGRCALSLSPGDPLYPRPRFAGASSPAAMAPLCRGTNPCSASHALAMPMRSTLDMARKQTRPLAGSPATAEYIGPLILTRAV